MIEVEAAAEEEVFARAALALGQILAGGGPLTQEVERTLEPAGHDRVSQLVGLLRDVLAAFYDERLILAAVDVRLGPPATPSATSRAGIRRGMAIPTSARSATAARASSPSVTVGARRYFDGE